MSLSLAPAHLIRRALRINTFRTHLTGKRQVKNHLQGRCRRIRGSRSSLIHNKSEASLRHIRLFWLQKKKKKNHSATDGKRSHFQTGNRKVRDYVVQRTNIFLISPRFWNLVFMCPGDSLVSLCSGCRNPESIQFIHKQLMHDSAQTTITFLLVNHILQSNARNLTFKIPHLQFQSKIIIIIISPSEMCTLEH